VRAVAAVSGNPLSVFRVGKAEEHQRARAIGPGSGWTTTLLYSHCCARSGKFLSCPQRRAVNQRKCRLSGREIMADKIVFIAFAVEDEATRNLFTGQRVNAKTPFTFIDMSVKEKYDSGWREKVTTRIRRSDGVIALISRDHSRRSPG
jgi:hypothetical protein